MFHEIATAIGTMDKIYQNLAELEAKGTLVSALESIGLTDEEIEEVQDLIREEYL